MVQEKLASHHWAVNEVDFCLLLMQFAGTKLGQAATFIKELHFISAGLFGFCNQRSLSNICLHEELYLSFKQLKQASFV